MQDFLTLTLNGQIPAQPEGRNEHLSWRWIDVGILEITPPETVSMALVVSAGVHGNETAPVEILEQMVDSLLRGERPLLTRLLVIYGNPAALRQNKRYLHGDMNRMFGGRWQQYEDCPEARRAWRLEQAMENFWQAGEYEEVRWHIDMHTAIRGSYHTRFGVMPQRDTPWPETFMDWLAAAGLEALVFHRSPGGTFTHYSSQHFQAASCTLELGKALPFGDNDLSQFSAAVRALDALISGGTLPEVAEAPRRYRVSQQITRHTDRFVLHMSDDTLNFTVFPQGALLAEDGDKRYYVQQAHEFVLFPNPHVASGLRAGLMLVEDTAHNEALGSTL
ncbi:MAG TPA: succinylglutamate desuccinylase [Erwinia persicina]|uniref:Succinylglutamate desuccinylase n=1 Tax=Erwinia persicina TaxID=55211 RepID=A0A4U3FLE8_9GAMM|nr:succinylglutamate desuccinylase [Erwinia persicina]MBD8105338.1 succinylglutamate desuccinylase [Erwinia persicina]MBD8208484.1 succinylglutamate desuccinylase [Erwinia persicina]MCQ4092193.1 succinylglutamate desuccinylase [Erwinia persicina]MCQ4099754.1 succinylglutamate desuccinylase [Erwinia persicina]QZQ48581.1 succinylglutamate desuccinylase [Erwinia persicina]